MAFVNDSLRRNDIFASQFYLQILCSYLVLLIELAKDSISTPLETGGIKNCAVSLDYSVAMRVI